MKIKSTLVKKGFLYKEWVRATGEIPKPLPDNMQGITPDEHMQEDLDFLTAILGKHSKKEENNE